jgi:long-chain-alcohol oxidase
MELSPKQIATFRTVADTLLPVIPGMVPEWSEPVPADRLPEVFALLPHDSVRADFCRFLDLLASPVGGSVLFGRPRAFTTLPPTERAGAWLAMQRHPLSLVRSGARALKTVVALLWISPLAPSDPRPLAWDAIGYPGPASDPPAIAPRLPVVEVDGDLTLQADVVVVGSGAGGAVAAAVLAGAGLDVVVLEAGGYHRESQFSHLEVPTYRDMYLQAALGSTADGATSMLAGATLGGGTVINYTTSFPTPPAIREEWDRVGGFDGVFTGEAYTASLTAVSARLGVNTDHGSPGKRDQVIEEGLRKLGWHVGEMPRNAVGCTETECGYCTMGCRIGAKQSTLATYLPDASAAGARIVPGCWVERVVTDGGKVTGLVARTGGHTVTVEAPTVILAAGALNTPAILLRSGLGGPAAGRYLRLHPVTAVWGRFEQRVEPWAGILQTRYSDEFNDLDGLGYGVKFETAPIHPLFPAAFFGWEDALSYKRDIIGLGHLGVVGLLLRDRDHGKVSIRKDGSPVWRYSISSYDQAHVRIGVRRGAEVLEAAGASEIISSTIRPVRWRPGHRNLDRFMSRIDAIGYGPNQTSYFSFHQMGSARMGADPQASVVDGTNQVHGVPGLYVMDGSCFPTSSGANPMLSISAIAHRGATLLAGRLA